MNTSTDTPALPRNRADLISRFNQGPRPKLLHFWGHTPPKTPGVNNSCFSQWWAGHPFTHEGIHYATAEHFMMAGKARLFGDEETLAKILSAKTPGEAKKLGRLVRNFDDRLWKTARWDIVVQGNLAKFSQHAELAEHLLKTGNAILVEASPFDRIWGIGMAVSDPKASDPNQWQGHNLLGFALVEVRERLKTH